MPKLKTQAITDKDLITFVEEEADFGFEMRVLHRLRELGYDYAPSGTYRDPVTDKMRQFDIRASIITKHTLLSLAVECKNIRTHNPLLISAVPRTTGEAFHDRILHRVDMGFNRTTVEPALEADTRYKVGETVGKRTDTLVCRAVGRAK
jgi:hypothetical protein